MKKSKVPKFFFKTNEQIKSQNVRIVNIGIDSGIYPISEALEKAKELELDLIEVSSKAVPPICKILVYEKFLYEQKKKKKESEKKRRESVMETKEIRFTPYTDEHDFEFKLKHTQNFLKKGNKVKVVVFFKGRSIKFKEQGEKILYKLIERIMDIGKAEALPKLEGKRMIVNIVPKK